MTNNICRNGRKPKTFKAYFTKYGMTDEMATLDRRGRTGDLSPAMALDTLLEGRKAL